METSDQPSPQAGGCATFCPSFHVRSSLWSLPAILDATMSDAAAVTNFGDEFGRFGSGPLRQRSRTPNP